MRYFLIVLTAMALVTVGCATKSYVDEEVAKLNQDVSSRVQQVEQSVEKNQLAIDQLDQKTDALEQKTSKLASATQEALNRAQEAQKLAKGKLLYEIVLDDDLVNFDFNSCKLKDEGKAALDGFATNLRKENRNVFLEIQGHTDSYGTEQYNMDLGEKRATVVMRYLHDTHGIPLQRMQVISYGESKPVADNNSRDGRAKNRRVVVIVME